MKKIILVSTVCLAAFCMFEMDVNAQSASETIKKNMAARKEKIDEFKTALLIGENAKGYLEILPEKTLPEESKKIFDAENTDRKAVYTAIAKQQETTEETVGKRRAIQLAKLAKTGEYIQDSNGKWIQKKAEEK